MAQSTAKQPLASSLVAESDASVSEIGAVSLTVLTSESGSLTKTYAPAKGGVRKVGEAAALVNGGARPVVTIGKTAVAALGELRVAIDEMPPNAAIMTGVAKSPLPEGRKAWEIVTAYDRRLNPAAGIISRSNAYFSPVKGPAFFPLDFDVKDYPPEIKAKLEAAGGLEAVMQAVCPALGEAARLVSPSASSHILNPLTGHSTGAAGEHWYFVLTDGRATVELAESIAARLEAAGWVWFRVTAAGTITRKTLIDTAASNPSRIWYEATPVLTGGLTIALEKARKVVPGRALRPDDVPPLTAAEEDARKRHCERSESAVAAQAAEVKAAREAELIEERVARGESPEAAAKAVKSAREGVLTGDHEITFDDGTVATVREMLDNHLAFHRKTCPDPMEPDYGDGRNIGQAQMGHPPQIFSQAHGGTVYRLYRDEAERAKSERGPLPEDFFDVIEDKTPAALQLEALAQDMFGASNAQAETTGRQFLAWRTIDPVTVPRVRFVYGDTYAAGYLTVTYAAPKVGKSLLGLAEAIDAATGRGFLTGRPAAPQSVLYFNAEDDQDVVDARVLAVLQHYGIPQSEIEGRLFAVSGISEDRQLVLVKGENSAIQEDTFKWLADFIGTERVGLSIFDPLQDLSQSPETNETFRALGGRIRRLGHDTASAIGMVHHTRKPSAGVQVTIDDGRGGSALRGVARFNRLLVPMTETEGAQAGVDDHRRFFRVAEAESNLAPPSADRNRWFEKVGVSIGNGAAYPSVKPWTWPEALTGVTSSHAARVRARIAERDAVGNPPRAHSAAEDWAGKIVADVVGIDLTGVSAKAGKARVASLLKAWTDAGFLAIEHRTFGDKAKSAPFIIAGHNVPEIGGDVFE